MPQARVPRVFSRVRRTDLHACKSLCHASRAFLRLLEPRLSAGWTLGLHSARLLVRWEKPLAATPDTSWFPTTLPKILEQYTHWKPHLHDLGECEVKHGVRVHLVNLYSWRTAF